MYTHSLTFNFKKAMPLLANVLSSIALIPELHTVITTWNVDDMSFPWIVISLLANFCWVTYGYIIQDYGVLSLGIIFSFFYSLLLSIKMTPKYKKKKSTHES